jgi:hypothetical protein
MDIYKENTNYWDGTSHTLTSFTVLDLGNLKHLIFIV